MKILVLNQYFPSDRSATAILLGQLVVGLAKKHHVHVICGTPTYNPDLSAAPLHSQNLIVDRIPIPSFSRNNTFSRIKSYLAFTWGTFLKIFKIKECDVVLCWTDPPWIALLAIFAAKKLKCKAIWTTQDIYPDIAELSGQLKDKTILSFFKRIMTFALSRIDHIVAIEHDMKQRLIEKGVPTSKISVIQNWQDEALLAPKDKTLFRNKHRLPLGAFIVMHSGNLGNSQDFESLIECAEELKNQADILFLIIGDGAKKDWLLQEIKNRSLWNVKWMPYQNELELSESLSCADIHYVSLYPKLWGYIVPSKFYGIAAAQKPMLANLPKECSLYTHIVEHQFGICALASGQELAKAIMSVRKDPDLIRNMGIRARAWFELYGTRALALKAYEKLIHKQSERT